MIGDHFGVWILTIWGSWSELLRCLQHELAQYFSISGSRWNLPVKLFIQELFDASACPTNRQIMSQGSRLRLNGCIL